MIKHLLYWKEIYLFLPFSVLSLWYHNALYSLLTTNGRVTVDPPVQIMNISRSIYFIFTMAVIVGLLQHTHFGYRSKGENPKLLDDIYDSCITIFLYVFCFVCYRYL